MAKFISKLKEISHKLNTGSSTEPEQPPLSDSQPGNPSQVSTEPENHLHDSKPEAGSSVSTEPGTLVVSDRKPEQTITPASGSEKLTRSLARLKEISTKLSNYMRVGVSPETGKFLLLEGETDVDTPALERQKLMRSLNHLKDKSRQAVIGTFTGSKPLYRNYKFWLGVGVGGGAIALGGVWISVERGLPDVNDVVTYVRDGTITIKAADGTILQQQGEATHEKLKIEQIPKPLIQAFIAAEDRRFYQHHGVDYQGIGRAFVSNLMARNVVEGGSTLTQQLARIVFLDQQRSFWRKLREFRLAQKIEDKLTKEQILERYLNLVYLGSGAYGIADASWVYYSKPLDQLTLPEMAMLASMAPAPSVYSPFVNEKVAKDHRNLVLQRMRDSGFITPQQAQEAIATPLTTKRSAPKRLTREAPYFTDYIQQQIPKYVSPDLIDRGGLTIETTLNPNWQQIAEEAIKKTIEENSKGQNFDQAAMVAVDPKTGQIKAMVGGKDFYQNQFNRVTQAQRQPGSTFKMFVYSTAIAAGFTPFRGYEDAPYTVDGYTPKNFSESYQGWLNMRDALTNSINVIAVKIMMDVGYQPVIDTARKMGIESPLKPTPSLALGNSEVNLLELTSAYGTLANKGMHIKAHGITRILGRDGNIIYEGKFKPQRALQEDTTAITTWMLRNVVNNGTGGAAQLNDRPVAGKTGTSDEARDLWFIGYIPQLVTGVWLGNDNDDPTWGSSSTAAETWNKFMAKAVEGMPKEEFPKRPDELEGRKPQIKVQPIKAKNVLYGRVNSDDSDDSPRPRRRRYQEETSSNNNSTNYRPRRSRYRNNSDDNSNEYRPRRRRVITTQQSDDSENTYRPRRRRVITSQQSDSSENTYRPRRRRVITSQQSDSSENTYRPRRRRVITSQQSDSSENTYRPRRRRVITSQQSDSSENTYRPRRRRVSTSQLSENQSTPRYRRRYPSADNNSGYSTPVRRRYRQSSASNYSPSRRYRTQNTEVTRTYTPPAPRAERRAQQYSEMPPAPRAERRESSGE